MSIYSSEIHKSDMLSVISDAEGLANLPFASELKLLDNTHVFKNDDVNEGFMQEVSDKYGHLSDDKARIRSLCVELAELAHNYMKTLANNDVDKIYDKWADVQKECDRLQEEEREAEAARKEEERKVNMAICACRNTLNRKISDAESNMKEFKYDSEWRKGLRRFIAEILKDTPRITGRQIAELANTDGGFDKNVSPYMIYNEWNTIKADIEAGTFGTHYPDNIVQKDTFMESVKANNVIKDTDLTGLLKKDLSIYDIINMLNEYDKKPRERVDVFVPRYYSRTACVIPDEELAYENFLEKESASTVEVVNSSNDEVHIPDDLGWMANVEVDESKVRDVSLDGSQNDVELIDEYEDCLDEVLEPYAEPYDIDEVSEIFK